MSKPKKHHYVPQGYLKFFSKENEKGDFITCVFDKKTRKEFETNIAYIAEKKYYNTVNDDRFIVPTPDGDPLYYEYKYIELIEGRIPQIINNVISACTLCRRDEQILSKKVKYDLATLIVVQLLRTPKTRQYMHELGEPIYRSITASIREQIESLQDMDKKKQFLNVLDAFNYTEAFSKSVHLQWTTDSDTLNKFIQVLVQNRSWVIYENVISNLIPFITSDNPILMYNLESKKSGLEVNALDNKMTVITMALTPKFMISLYHKGCVYGHYSQEFENKCVPIKETEFILNQTWLQLEQCSRQTYKKPDYNNQKFDSKF